MDKIAVMGDLESVQGFAALGLDIYPYDGAEEAAAVFRRLAGGEYGIIFLTEEAYALLERDIRRLEETLTPAVIPIPCLLYTSWTCLYPSAGRKARPPSSVPCPPCIRGNP